MVHRQFSGTRHLVRIPCSKGEVRPDFVIFVWFSDTDLDDCRIFVVPAEVADRDVLKSHKALA